MKILTVRLPDALAAKIETESKASGVSKSVMVRRKLQDASPNRRSTPTFFDMAGDLIGSVNDNRMPRDLSARKKRYLKKRGYGENRHR